MNVYRAMNSNSSRKMVNLNQRNVVHKVRVPLNLLPPSSPSPISVDSVDSPTPDCCFSRFLVQNHSNFKRSGPPARVMYYDGGSWTDFDGDVVGSLREGFREGKAVVELGHYLFDLYRMLQVDLESGNQRSVAWIDDHGKSFFPKTFVDDFTEDGTMDVSQNTSAIKNSASGNLKLEIEITLGDGLHPNSTNKKRGVAEIDSGEGCSSNEQLRGVKKPKIIAHEVDSPRWPKSKMLKEGDKAYAIVKNLFLSGSNATITSIHQCVRNDPIDKARREVFLKQLETMKAARGEARMMFAWCGTSAKDASSILTHGFSMPTKVPESEAHGVGVYLNPVSSPHASAMLSEEDENGEKHVILCRVILGKCEKVQAGSGQSYPSSADFDTGVDDLMNPKWYVVWCANMNTHVLPECVVSFKASRAKPDQFRDPAYVRYAPGAATTTFGKLLNKLKNSNSLTSTRLKELQVLCTAFKDGKVSKDSFLKQLRSVVGEQLLISTLREVCG